MREDILMHMEVGPVRVLHPVFEKVVNNSFSSKKMGFLAHPHFQGKS